MSLPVAVTCAALGAAAGVALPRVAYRLSVPYGMPPRSGCHHCGLSFPTGWRGWLHPGGACPCAGLPGAGLVGAVAASTVAAVVTGVRLDVPELPVYLLAALLGVVLAAVDLRCLRLPDPLVAALTLVTVLPLVAIAAVTGEPERLGRAILAALLSFVAYLVPAMLPGGGIGFGDVKLAAVLGFLLGWLGWPAVVLGSVAPHLINGPVALVLLGTGRVHRRTALPFGPALLAGALLAVAIYA